MNIEWDNFSEWLEKKPSQYLSINHSPRLYVTKRRMVYSLEKLYNDMPISPEDLVRLGYLSAIKRCRASNLIPEQLTCGDCGSSALAISMTLKMVDIEHQIWVSSKQEEIDNPYPSVGHVGIYLNGHLYDWKGKIKEEEIYRISDDCNYDRLDKINGDSHYNKIWAWFRRSTAFLIEPVSYLDQMSFDILKLLEYKNNFKTEIQIPDQNEIAM